jgi:uncharacterized protein
MKLIKVLVLAVAFILPIAAHAEINGDDQVAYTQALRDGDVKTVQKYLDSGISPNEQFFTWTAIQIAANKGQLAVVKLLVEKGADINYKHPVTKMTSFQLAAYENYPEVVKYLASKGADIDAKMRGDISIIRAIRDEGNTKMVDLLISLGVKDDGCKEEKCF